MTSEWINLVDAVRALRDARQVNEGVAIKLLRQACETEVVQSRKRPWPDDEDEDPPNCWLPCKDWHGARISLEHQWLVLASGEVLRAVVEINAAELRSLLGVEEAKPEEVQSTPVGRKRGPKPDKLEATKQAMRDAIVAGLTELQLQAMKEEALAETYKVSRDTARKARKAVLS